MTPTEDNTSEEMLTATALSKQFGPVSILDGLSVAFTDGEVAAVIGPNGSGKTTLLRLLVGELSPSTGEVTYQGPSVPRPIGYLPQQPAFRSGFTVRETLEFYQSLVRDTDPMALLDLVGLEGAANRRVDALSGGMRQLLGIAQALVGDPPVVILDEPASGLDPTMRDHVFAVIADLATTGRTVIVSSHDLSFVESDADSVVLLAAGQIAATGTPNSITAQFEVSTLREALQAVTDETDQVTVVGETDQ